MEAISSNHRRIQWPEFILILGTFVFFTACSPQSGNLSPTEPVVCPECEMNACPEPIRYEDVWATSPHADEKAESFNHWNEDDPQEIPKECAKCHSMPGFIDFLGIDGTLADQVDNPAVVGTTVTCYVCHNEATDDLNSAIFPSGVKIRLLGPETRCIQCHQGRASTLDIDEAIMSLALSEADVPSQELSFINSHSISGATPFGGDVQSAYQYDGKIYKGRFNRGEEFFSCIRCHDQHSLETKTEICGDCHTMAGAETRDIRVDTTDFDGDGDTIEGIAYEISTVQDALFVAIQTYGRQIVKVPITYDIDTYPYFFIDTNNSGDLDIGENIFENRYNAWTPRLLRAAYNYNYSNNDPGAYAHNSDYLLQVLYDSLADIGGDITGMTRP